MSAPTANELYVSCMENAGDLCASISMHSKLDVPIDVRAAANRQNAQAVLALVQSAVTIHAASKTARNGR
jgi:hypothetical protein